MLLCIVVVLNRTYGCTTKSCVINNKGAENNRLATGVEPIYGFVPNGELTIILTHTTTQVTMHSCAATGWARMPWNKKKNDED